MHINSIISTTNATNGVSSMDDYLQRYQDFFPREIYVAQQNQIRGLEERTISQVRHFCLVLGYDGIDQAQSREGENYMREMFMLLGRKATENFLNT